MHVVVDGSNLATEGRTLPSLQQLIAGVVDFRTENPDAEVVVVVDATFGHRIDGSEVALFEDAIVHQEIVSPPAGAIGRGDAFVLRIAEKVGAVVLSNDSFQEFHAEHEWLFERGRLIGGKPVPGVGWIFTPRTPVRGPKSREVTSEAKRKQRKGKVSAEAPLVTGAELLEKGRAALDKLPKARREKVKKDEPSRREPNDAGVEGDEVEGVEGEEKEPATAGRGRDGGGSRRGRRGRGPVDDAIAVATVEAVVPSADRADDGAEDDGGGKRRKRRRKPTPPAEPVNEPGVFLHLAESYRPGDLVQGEVETFSSHGAFIIVDGARCYIPLTLLGDPAPRAARDVLKRGEVRPFVLRAYDAARRGVELALPGIELPVGPVSAETAAAAVGAEATDEEVEAAEIEAEVKQSRRRAKKAAAVVEPPLPVPAPTPTAAKRSRKKVAAATEAAPVPAAEAAPAEVAPAPRKRAAKKKAAPVESPLTAPVAAPEAVPAKRSRKKVAIAPVAVEAEPAPAVIEPIPDPAPVPATRPRASRKARPAGDLPAATLVAEAAPARKRATKKASSPAAWAAAEPVAEPAPAPPPARKRAVKKVAAAVVAVVAEEPPTAPPAPTRKRATKKAATVATAAPEPAPAAKAARRTPRRKAPDPS